ncbi:hypothetical protein, partial [Bacillus altitudinis]|uniref:hypothetical protein n=1 Tax=Bacillus altitudinis TaxID=293387 RepID=UPI001C92C810
LILVIFSVECLVASMMRGERFSCEKKESLWKERKGMKIKKGRKLIGERVRVRGMVRGDEWGIGNGKV